MAVYKGTGGNGVVRVWFDEELGAYLAFMPDGTPIPCQVDISIDNKLEEALTATIKVFAYPSNEKPIKK